MSKWWLLLPVGAAIGTVALLVKVAPPVVPVHTTVEPKAGQTWRFLAYDDDAFWEVMQGRLQFLGSGYFGGSKWTLASVLEPFTLEIWSRARALGSKGELAMNVIATLLGGSVLAGGAVALGVIGKQKSGEQVPIPVGTKIQLVYRTSRPLTSTESQALLWSFQDNFPGTIEGFAFWDPTTLLMNVVSMSPAAYVIGAVGAFDDIVLQLTDVVTIEKAQDAPAAPSGTVYA